MKNDSIAWRSAYKELYRKHLERNNPVFAKDFPNHEPVIGNEKKTNVLTKLIMNWITWKGYYVNRVNTQGQHHIQKIPRFSLSSGKVEYTDKVRFTKSTTKKGTPDLQAVIKGKAVFIEVKAGKDKIKDPQEEQKSDIEKAGGYHLYAKDMQGFVEWYLQTFEAVKKEERNSFFDWY